MFVAVAQDVGNTHLKCMFTKLIGNDSGDGVATAFFIDLGQVSRRSLRSTPGNDSIRRPTSSAAWMAFHHFPARTILGLRELLQLRGNGAIQPPSLDLARIL